MEIPAKNTEIHTFEGPVSSDVGKELMPRNQTRKMLNTRRTTLGDKGLITNILGNLLIAAGYATGNSTGLGYITDQQYNKLYYFNYNDQAYHGIYMFDALTLKVTPVLQNLVDTNNVDILRFDLNNGINQLDITYVQNDTTGQVNTLLYWVDGLNKARKANVQKCLDKTATGYGTIITEDLITAYKQTFAYPPQVIFITDTIRTSNYCYGKQFKFSARPYYADGEIGNWCDWSGVPLPPNEDFQGQEALTFTNNAINVTVQTGSKDVVKIEIGMQTTNTDPSGDIATLPWVSVVTLIKSDLSIPDYGNYTFVFYNDGSYGTIDQSNIGRQFSFMPRVPKIQSLVKIALIYGNFYEGFNPVPVNVSIALTFQPFYLPNSTISQLNSPSVTISLTSATSSGGIFNTWWTTLSHFIIGEDVKAGNIFVLNAFGGNGNRTFSYPCGLGDSATTVASAIKQWLRSIDSVGIGTGGGAVVSNESTDMSGNVSWDFTIQAHEGKNAITFGGSVNPINYSTLLDNGLSINTKKMGSVEKYGFVYIDDDGRESLAYTEDSCLVRIPFETETLPGTTAPLGLQQPIVTLSIKHVPPAWARYYRVVKTAGPSTFIQLLIQQVNVVTVANESSYLDLIVGSLFTYQKIHPDTVLAYQFTRGDRLRLVADESTVPATPYTPFFETEILSYIIDEEQFRDASISYTGGTNVVTPADGVQATFVGKYIIIGGNQRIIESVSGGTYILDEVINPDPNYIATPTSAVVYPNYTIKDTRGIIRINIPPSSYNVVAMAKIEVYRPQQNIDNQDFQSFFDFQQKFEILNFGTANASHAGNLQNQDPANPITTPAIVQVTYGNAFVRNRAMPSNNQDPNPQVIIDKICDANFSDFYVSNLYNDGRVYPQDRGLGQVNFPQRVRFSNNFIQNTQVNGLNDFDELDYVDYNDPYGAFTLAKFKRGVLYLFKQLKTTWTHVYQRLIVSNNGEVGLATSDQLLNELQYAEWEGGIGDNPESFIEDGDFMYIGSANSGVYIRIGQDGSIPISEIFFYDKRSKELLENVNTYNLKMPGGFDKPNGEVIWTVPDFIQYLFNNQFNVSDWSTTLAAYPDGTTWAIITQPANSTAAIVSGQIEITGTNTLGPDSLQFQGTLPLGAGLTPIINLCFTIVAAPPATAWRIQSASVYCLQGLGVNNGQQGWKILEQYNLATGTTTGLIMPNAPIISPEAIVPNTATITYNQATNISPSGGANGDVWYNLPANQLYKKVAGIWSLLNDTAINSNYAPSIKNLTDCPLPTPPAGNWLLSASYNVEIVSVVNGTSTGTPAAYATANVPSGSNLPAVYTTQTAGTIVVQFSGTPMPPGHVKADLVVNGVVVDTQVITNTFPTYTFTFPVTTNDPTTVSLEVNSF